MHQYSNNFGHHPSRTLSNILIFYQHTRLTLGPIGPYNIFFTKELHVYPLFYCSMRYSKKSFIVLVPEAHADVVGPDPEGEAKCRRFQALLDPLIHDLLNLWLILQKLSVQLK